MRCLSTTAERSRAHLVIDFAMGSPAPTWEQPLIYKGYEIWTEDRVYFPSAIAFRQEGLDEEVAHEAESIEDARAQIDELVRCSDCNGKGEMLHEPFNPYQREYWGECSGCDGKGEVY